jgi:ankyrin repeat protein
MPPPELPLELLLLVAYNIRDDDGGLRYGDFNSFLQANRVLYACLNHQLWKEAAEHEVDTQRVFTHFIKSNNFARLEFFLELGADAEVRLPAFQLTGHDLDEGEEQFDDFHPTPLLVAADLNNVPLARLLLENGAKVQYTGPYRGDKLSPIHAARSAEMVRLLLDYGADPNSDDGEELLPLHWYAIRDDLAAMREILEHGAEVNPILQGDKPLHTAAWRSLDAVKLLVQYGADVTARDPSQNTPLYFAAMAGKLDVVEFLVALWPEAMDERGHLRNTPLHAAAGAGKTDVVKYFLELWPEGIRETNVCRATPLHCAVETGATDVARLLLERWPQGVKERNRSGNTPLHLAVGNNLAIEVVELLVESWPEGVKEKTHSGGTPLHLAARAGKADVVRLLLERWPQGMQAMDDEQETPLHYAATAGIDVVRLLLERWPEGVKEKTHFGDTPLHLATRTGMADVVRLLLERWPEGVRTKDSSGNTPLHLVAYCHLPIEVVGLLVERWPEGLREKNRFGQTPLRVAAAKGHTKIVAFLKQRWLKEIM